MFNIKEIEKSIRNMGRFVNGEYIYSYSDEQLEYLIKIIDRLIAENKLMERNIERCKIAYYDILNEGKQASDLAIKMFNILDNNI